ncbi:MAG: PilZ domain-containing protein [Planctomycetota bacterium]|nr:PilZ domain-containing protein [Planctomycetota bacterium]
MKQKNRRQSGRLDYEGKRCSLGRILNISSGGLVVRSRRPKQVLTIIDLGAGANVLHLKVKLVWSRRSGFGAYLRGYKFIDPPGDLHQKLYGTPLSTSTSRVI